MDRPTVGEVAEVVYADLAGNAFGDEDLDWPLLFFVGAIAGALFQDTWDLVQDQPDQPGWADLLSPSAAPAYALSYAAQFAGVDVQPRWTEAEIRDALQTPTAFRRGTTKHIVAIVQRFLTGSKSVKVRQRQGGAWKLMIRTNDTESPLGGSADGDAMIVAALKSESKPAGITLDFESLAGIEYLDLEEDWVTYGDLEAEGLTYAELREFPL